ncbi:hypothetical protein [Legionella bononiensis]|uniref:Uncharacterized protein n=1 Tax=Legionella bononiensis TaxID=2793102 RepID=A0ABS1W9B0_9GAMM|nr:hypothetical protein [Legionella bononiensis]MBL7480879.1 hypothetical protein [Legionella bononiensis]MBL7525939.1 hypothetical protein [Legionella bononiensis]MBL7563994.1 hypothetical protein [Legionella bononiensis]
MSVSKAHMKTLFGKSASLLSPELTIENGKTIVALYLKKSTKSLSPSALVSPDQVVVALEKNSDEGRTTFSYYNSTGYSSRGFGEISGIDQVHDTEQAKMVVFEFLSQEQSDKKVFFQVPTATVNDLMDKVVELFNQKGHQPKHVDGEPMLEDIKGVFIKAGHDVKAESKKSNESAMSFCSVM